MHYKQYVYVLHLTMRTYGIIEALHNQNTVYLGNLQISRNDRLGKLVQNIESLYY